MKTCANLAALPDTGQTDTGQTNDGVFFKTGLFSGARRLVAAIRLGGNKGTVLHPIGHRRHHRHEQCRADMFLGIGPHTVMPQISAWDECGSWDTGLVTSIVTTWCPSPDEPEPACTVPCPDSRTVRLIRITSMQEMKRNGFSSRKLTPRSLFTPAVCVKWQYCGTDNMLKT